MTTSPCPLQTSSHTLTFLKSYNLTVLRSYALTVLRFYDLTVLRSYGLLITIFLFLCTSCHTRRYATYTPATNSTIALSTNYGIRLTPRDNHTLYNTVAQWLGTPYRSGQNTMRGTDCSGFAGNIYRTVYKKNLARSTADILRLNCSRISRQNLREGDLVFFATGITKKASHVGIYLKDDKFAHASTSKGVIISNLNETYYRKRWLTGGRVR